MGGILPPKPPPTGLTADRGARAARGPAQRGVEVEIVFFTKDATPEQSIKRDSNRQGLPCVRGAVTGR